MQVAVVDLLKEEEQVVQVVLVAEVLEEIQATIQVQQEQLTGAVVEAAGIIKEIMDLAVTAVQE
jgi:hypothetical protein